MTQELHSTDPLADAYRMLAQMPSVDRRRIARALKTDKGLAMVVLFKEGLSMAEIALRYGLELAQVEAVIRRRLP